jgi:outer membrane murein-binding lipoprotein Lpp
VSTPDRESDARDHEVRIRRAPKFAVFAILGAILGVIIALILTAAFPIDPTVGFGATFGYFTIYGVVLGVLAGCVVAIILDRTLGARVKTLRASIDRLQPADDDDAVDQAAEPRDPSS